MTMGRLIDADALLAAIDAERQILVEQKRLGAEHIVVHHARRLIEDSPTVDAIPVEWIENKREEWRENGAPREVLGVLKAMLVQWRDEQEGENG